MEEFPSTPGQFGYSSVEDQPRINVSVEKNTKGYNFSATVVNAKSTEEAMEILNKTVAALKAEYGQG